MKFIFSVAAILCFLSMNAQDSTSGRGHLKVTYVPGDKTKRDSIIPAGPNELYLNIGPSLSVLQGAWATSETNLTFMYKRAIKNSRLAYRMGIAYKAEVRKEPETISLVNGIYSVRGVWYTDITDSSRIKRRMDESPTKKLQLNLGMERRSKGKRRWTGFYGLDLVFGFYNHQAALYRERQKSDMFGNWYDEQNDSSNVMLDYKKSTDYYFGISPKAGLSYAFNSHWVISAQAAVLATYDVGEYFAWNEITDKIHKVKSNTFNFGFNGIIDELNLVYRF